MLDAGHTPASGASGLPVGLYAPYTSADNNLSSQITSIGVGATHQLAKSLLLEGFDWQPSGLMTRKYGESERWQAHAGWIKPLALVQACLAQTGVTWQGDCDVKQLKHDGELWNMMDGGNKVLAQAKSIVIAASNQSADLLQTGVSSPRLILQATRGQVTFGNLQQIEANTRSHFPINGHGSYIETNDSWLVAATYDRENLSLDAKVADQVENFERLEQLAPTIADQLKPAFTRGEVQNWVGIRCASTDRLPIVGEVKPGLWVITAMASRGLTFAPLCAEVLAANMSGETLTANSLNERQLKAISVQRYLKKR